MSRGEHVESESTERQKRIEPGVLQTALLDEIAGRLLSLETLTRKEVPFGAVEPIEPITVTDQGRLVEAHYGPWHSVTMINDGKQDVLAVVNTKKSFEEHRVVSGETYTVNMLRPLIHDVLLKCERGLTSTVRFVGAR